ncbi:hypothetical protein [Algoriphagus taiwanensis]|uniref:Uncharacterized protein n=1 Tax=Algoriphagus taiwanensis TaxID=1445656 RepID=A0ABQ6Q626_9BACT|nr:hypothetical protein Ataiwa_35840 [Algoriphagus taiwanensis]
MIYHLILWLFLFQSSPSLENKIGTDIISGYLGPSSTRDVFVVEVLDTLGSRIYPRILDPKNEYVYKDLNEIERRMALDLLKFKEPISFDRTSLFQNQGLQILEERRKDAYEYGWSSIKLSRISISADHQTACLILEYRCGSKCASGLLIFAQLEGDTWKIAKRKQLWES